MKYNFQNQKVNDFIESLNYSSFISQDFISKFKANCNQLFLFRKWLDETLTELIDVTILSDEQKDLIAFREGQIKEYFANIVEDINRIGIFSESFKLQMIDVLTELALSPKILS